ncbi:acyltransferase [Raineyella sp. LH-20]|uniref:acyltransferase family protein n=1 Tax=Raineyella sp. LH-20 TaxID=3081204 RepID=UPI0029537F0E|nr:acyltransferase [Raineyella sp. LH-20]WOP20116.1 acyltransferase [Raineyella sp. LH-20]
MRTSLGEALSSHDNALNFVRLCLASAVIVSHTIPVAGYGAGWYDRLEGWGGWAVNGFFIASGYLIAGSRLRTGPVTYLWRRALRILPGFWVNLALTAFLFAPLSTLLTGNTYSPLDGFRYLAADWALRMNVWNVGTTLADVPYPNVWNGSLWTLWYEFGAYLVAGVLLTIPLARKHGAVVFGTLTFATVVGLPLAIGPLDVTTNLYLNGLRLAAFFCTGMFLFFVRDHIPTHWWVGATALGTVALLSAFGLAPAWGQLPYGVLLLWLGARLPVRWGARNDLSYGVYIYAFPVQQFLAIVAGDRLPFVVTCLLALALTIPLAAASWIWVEKPVMRFKKVRFPRPSATRIETLE